MDEPTWTEDELRNHALALEAIYRLCGPGGAYFQMAAQRLPADLDLALLQPYLAAGVPLPAPPVQDPRY